MLKNNKQQIRKKITKFQIPSCKYWILDTDVGCDDAQAIVNMIYLAKKYDKIILGITCVNGNAYLKDVIINTMIVLAVCETKIPVYAGCQKSILDEDIKDQFFGPDGFGRQQLIYIKNLKEKLDFTLLQNEHASKFICQSAKKYQNQLGIITIGPLTNLAMAYYLDSQVCNRIKMISCMGGNYTAIGLQRFFSSEFNVHIDTIAAHVVFKKFKNIYICSIDLALDDNNQKSLSTLTNYSTPKAKLIAQIYNDLAKRGIHSVCDPMAVFVALGGRQYIDYAYKAKCQISQLGSRTKGYVTVDWQNDTSKDQLKDGVVMFIGKLHIDKVSEEIMKSYQ